MIISYTLPPGRFLYNYLPTKEYARKQNELITLKNRITDYIIIIKKKMENII